MSHQHSSTIVVSGTGQTRTESDLFYSQYHSMPNIFKLWSIQ